MTARTLSENDSAPSKTVAERPHILALNGLRGLAILLVLFDHLTVMDGTSKLDSVVSFISRLGVAGVDLFFVLSGFLITGILFDAKNGKHFFSTFYARRTVRIFPLYYAIVALCLLVLPRLTHHLPDSFRSIEGSEIWYWLYLSNFSIAWHDWWQHPILGVSWSLAIEEQFYLVWPCVIFFLRRQWSIAVCCVLIAAALVCRLVLALRGNSEFDLYVITFCRMDGLAVGALIALVARGPGGLARWNRFAPFAFLGALAAALALVVIRWRTTGYLGMMGHGYIEPFASEITYQTLIYSLLAVLFGATLVRVVYSPPPCPSSGFVRFLRTPFMRMFGRYSYGIYLFNLPLRAFVRDAIYPPARFPTLLGSQLPGQILFYGLALAVILAAAWLSFHLYEKHFLKLKRYFPAEVAQVPRATVPTDRTAHQTQSPTA